MNESLETMSEREVPLDMVTFASIQASQVKDQMDALQGAFFAAVGIPKEFVLYPNKPEAFYDHRHPRPERLECDQVLVEPRHTAKCGYRLNLRLLRSVTLTPPKLSPAVQTDV